MQLKHIHVPDTFPLSSHPQGLKNVLPTLKFPEKNTEIL